MEEYKKYGLTDEDINEISDSLDQDDFEIASFYTIRISKLFDYLLSIGITDLKGIFIYKPLILYYSKEEIKKAIEESSVSNIVELLKEDVSNFELLGF